MKRFVADPVLHRVVRLSALILFSAGLLRSHGESGRAEVRAVRGSAAYSTTNQPLAALKAGLTLYPGTVIKTAAESTVDLYLGRAGVVRVTENTTLGIDVLERLDTGIEEIQDVQLDLPAGTILGNVSKLSRASKYEIKLPDGIVGIRGTRYRCTTEAGRTKLLLLDGTMVFVPAPKAGPIGVPVVLDAPPAVELDSVTNQPKPAPADVLERVRQEMPPVPRPAAPALGPVARAEIFVQPVHVADKNLSGEFFSPTKAETNAGGR